MLTQAFSYSAIRILEGYWHFGGPLGWARSRMIRHQVERRGRANAKRRRAAQAAFNDVRAEVVQLYSYTVAAALEVQAVEGRVPPLEGRDKEIYELTNWRAKCNAWSLSKVDHYDRRRKEYPKLEGRTMPTVLGNVLRSYEDALKNVGKDLQGFAMRTRPLVPPRLQLQHDQFRQRLDMYCILVFVSAFCAILTATLLTIGVEIENYWGIGGLALGFLLLGAVSYVSAIASARGYGATLRVMDDAAGKAGQAAG